MSPERQRAFDIAAMALTGACLAVLIFGSQDTALTAFCSGVRPCFQGHPDIAPNARHLALATLTGIALYAFLIRFPRHYRQWRLKNNFERHCRAFKDTLIGEMEAVATGSTTLAGRESLFEPFNFRAFFESELSPGRTRWDAFQTNLDRSAITRICLSMQALHDEITFVLNTVPVQCYAPLELRKRLCVTLVAIESNPHGAETTRLLADFLWAVFAGRNAVYGIREEDLLTKTLTAIVSNPALPFSPQWWRTTNRKEPVSVYETLL
jgi:hypothetical protein